MGLKALSDDYELARPRVTEGGLGSEGGRKSLCPDHSDQYLN